MKLAELLHIKLKTTVKMTWHFDATKHCWAEISFKIKTKKPSPLFLSSFVKCDLFRQTENQNCEILNQKLELELWDTI